MNPLLKYCFICSAIFMISCKKDSKNDSIIAQAIHGQVFNLATDSGLVNTDVYLRVIGPISTTLSTMSGVNGMFTFSIPVHSSDDYTYELYVPSKSGFGDVGIDGCDGNIIKSNINQIQSLQVVPHAKFSQLYFTNTLFTSNDTFVLTLQQTVFHKNVPKGVWQVVDSCSPCNISMPAHTIGNISNYWMGWWHIKYDKKANGIHTVKTDSFYVGWGATITDTIPW